MRNVLAAVAGIVAAIVTVYLIQMIGHMVYPPPADLESASTEQMAAYVAGLPLPALLFPMISYFIGTFDGVVVASLIGSASTRIYALIVGGLVLVAAVSILILIPHPNWYSGSAVIGIIGSALLGAKVGDLLQKNKAAAAAPSD